MRESSGCVVRNHPCAEPPAPSLVARCLSILFAIGVIGLAASASAETYQWTDANGALHFSDRPPAAGNNQYKVREEESAPRGQAGIPPPAPSYPVRPDRSQRRVDGPGPPVPGRSSPPPRAWKPIQVLEPKFVREDGSPVYRLKSLLDKKDYKGAELLLKQGENIDAVLPAFGMTLAQLYAQAGNLDGVRFLAAHGANVRGKEKNGTTALISAAAARNRPVVEFLLAKGADVHFRNSDGYTALAYAATRDWKEGAELLIRRGARVDVRTNNGYAILHWVSASGYTEIARLLIDHGADVNEPLYRGSNDHMQRTPLLLALENGRFATADLLVRRGARTRGPELRGKIVEFIQAGKTDAAKYLILKGGDVDDRDGLQRTPLMAAAAKGRADLVDLLLDRGADVRLQELDRFTASSFAARAGETGIANRLRALEDRGKAEAMGPRGPSVPGNGQPSPYSKAFAETLERTAGTMAPLAIPKEARTEARYRAVVEHHRELFRKAGYDYDATLRKLRRDLEGLRTRGERNELSELQTGEINAVSFIMLGLQFMESQCRYDRVDCLAFFDPPTAEAIRYLWTPYEPAPSPDRSGE
jgi:ankyrin repeat protein